MTLSRRRIILLICCSSIFFEALDIAIVNLAMPLVQHDFHLPADAIQWMQVLYVLFYGGFLILGGKLADALGRKKIFIAGSAIFMLTSLGAGLSSEYYVLLINRAVQGLGAALVVPAAFSIITNTYTQVHARNNALAVFGSFAAIGSGSGLSVGGIIATWLGWQWIFMINVPVIAIAIVFAWFYIPADEKAGKEPAPDVLAAVLLTAGLLTATYVVHELKSFAQHWPAIVVLTLLSVLLLTIFFLRNANVRFRLIDFPIISSTDAITGYGAMVLMGAFFTGYLFMISLVLQFGMEFSASRAGLLLLPFSILSALVSKFALPPLIQRWGVQRLAILGMFLMMMGGLFLSLAIVSGYTLLLVLISIACVTGTGIAVCFMAFNVSIVQNVDPSHHGLASSVATASFFFGGGLGLSILSLSLTSDSTYLEPVIVMTTFAVIGLVWLLLRKHVVRIQSGDAASV